MQCDWWVPVVQLAVQSDWWVPIVLLPSIGVKCVSTLKMVAVCSPEILIPTHYSTISLHSQKYHNRKLTSNFLTTCSRALCLYSALDYSIKGLYIMTTDTLLCLKVNSTFLTGTLTHNIKLLMIQQLPSQPQGLTHN